MKCQPKYTLIELIGVIKSFPPLITKENFLRILIVKLNLSLTEIFFLFFISK